MPVLDGSEVGRHSLAETQRIEVEELVLKEGVVAIGTAAFARLPNLKTVVIPSTIQDWGLGGTFRDCHNLSDVVVNCRRIGDRVFANCTNLRNIRLNGTVDVGELAFAGCRPEVCASVESQRRTNVLRAAFEEHARMDDFGEFLPGYQSACERFDAINDWQNAEVLDELVYSQDNHIANLGPGVVQMPGVRAIGTDRLGEFLNRLSGDLRNGAEDETLADYQQEFFNMVEGNGNPKLIFTRHIAGVAHKRYVPVPNFEDMNACYVWMAANNLIDEHVGGAPGGDARENLVLWLRQSKAVHNALSQYLGDKTEAERGVFAWLLARNQNHG